MHGAELLVQYFIADRLREARQDRLARLAVAARKEQANEGNRTSVETWSDESWLPRLRGYPIDPEFARSAR